MSKAISIQPYYRYEDLLWKVNAGEFKPIYPWQLRKIIEQIDAMRKTYLRTFTVFFDLHMPIYSEKNTLVTDFLRRLRTKLKSVYRINKFGFSWCREQDQAENPHYHFMLMVNGSAISYPDKLIRLIKSLWRDICDGTVHQSEHGYYMMIRNDELIMAEVIYRASYQAKLRTKSNRPAETKSYGTSRLKSKKQPQEEQK